MCYLADKQIFDKILYNPDHVYTITFHPFQPFLRITLSDCELMTGNTQIVPDRVLWTIIL